MLVDSRLVNSLTLVFTIEHFFAPFTMEKANINYSYKNIPIPNCSIAAFYGGFYFSFDRLTAYLLIFSTGVTKLAFSFFFFFFFVL